MRRGVVIVDNYDSFTYNLADAFGRLGETVRVVRSDAVDVQALCEHPPLALVVSPGPGTPERAGKSIEAIRALMGKSAILGVCLGHQALGVALGGRVARAPEVVHGRASVVHHVDHPLFAGIPAKFAGGRYHSLALTSPLPDTIVPLAHTADGVVMAVAARNAPAFGVQFHPESILTKTGPRLLRNFLSLAGAIA